MHSSTAFSSGQIDTLTHIGNIPVPVLVPTRLSLDGLDALLGLEPAPEGLVLLAEALLSRLDGVGVGRTTEVAQRFELILLRVEAVLDEGSLGAWRRAQRVNCQSSRIVTAACAVEDVPRMMKRSWGVTREREPARQVTSRGSLRSAVGG